MPKVWYSRGNKFGGGIREMLRLKRKCPSCKKLAPVIRPRSNTAILFRNWDYKCPHCDAEFSVSEEKK